MVIFCFSFHERRREGVNPRRRTPARTKSDAAVLPPPHPPYLPCWPSTVGWPPQRQRVPPRSDPRASATAPGISAPPSRASRSWDALFFFLCELASGTRRARALPQTTSSSTRRTRPRSTPRQTPAVRPGLERRATLAGGHVMVPGAGRAGGANDVAAQRQERRSQADGRRRRRHGRGGGGGGGMEEEEEEEGWRRRRRRRRRSRLGGGGGDMGSGTRRARADAVASRCGGR